MDNKKKIAFYTLGCKLNYSETETIMRAFDPAHYQTVAFDHPADYYVINTCSVTQTADSKCRNVIRKAKKLNPHSIVVITGCYAQLDPKYIAKLPGVNYIFGSKEKFNIPDFLRKRYDNNHNANEIPHHSKGVFVEETRKLREFKLSFSYANRTRAILKIQDGCDYFCSFCSIPMARGRNRSATIKEILCSVETLIKNNIKEIVLSGINIGEFGKEKNEKFIDLLKALSQLDKTIRFRISSVEPNLLTDEIIDLIATSDHFMPHFHIPLQSGSDKILKLMRRKYNRKLFIDRITHINSSLPDCCIGVDIITGFPGEEAADFDMTYQLIRDLPCSYLHVFPYSERPATKAAQFSGKVPHEIKKRRADLLRILSEKKREHFYRKNVGKQSDVLFESENHKGYMHGFTPNYIKVKAPFNPSLTNTITRLMLSGIDKNGLMESNPLCKDV